MVPRFALTKASVKQLRKVQESISGCENRCGRAMGGSGERGGKDRLGAYTRAVALYDGA